jgi:hypothetical protein
LKILIKERRYKKEKLGRKKGYAGKYDDDTGRTSYE